MCFEKDIQSMSLLEREDSVGLPKEGWKRGSLKTYSGVNLLGNRWVSRREKKEFQRGSEGFLSVVLLKEFSAWFWKGISARFSVLERRIFQHILKEGWTSFRKRGLSFWEGDNRPCWGEDFSPFWEKKKSKVFLLREKKGSAFCEGIEPTVEGRGWWPRRRKIQSVFERKFSPRSRESSAVFGRRFRGVFFL